MANQQFCPHCGRVNTTVARFCAHCGQPLPVQLQAAVLPRRQWLLIGAVLFLLTLIAAAGLLLLASPERPFTRLIALTAGTASTRNVATATLNSTLAIAARPLTDTPIATSTLATVLFTSTPLPMPSNTPSPSPTSTSTSVPVSTPTTAPLTASDVVALQIPSPPVIDGLLSQWDPVPAYLSAYQVHQAVTWDGSQDLKAVWQLVWDSNSLYVGVTVTDDVHVQIQQGNLMYRGDSLEIQIDTGRIHNTPATSLNPDHFQLILSPGDFSGIRPSAFRFRGNSQGQMRDALGHHITVAAQRVTTGYALEAAIPWSDLSVLPQPGLVLGLTLNANDNDTPGTAVQEVMMSNVSTRTFGRPETWGTLTLQPNEQVNQRTNDD